MKVGVRVSYPEEGKYNWYDALKAVEAVGLVEVAFFDPRAFLPISIESVCLPFSKLKLEVDSVHAPHVSLMHKGFFVRILEKTCEIAKRLDARYIIVHPYNIKLEKVVDFLDCVVAPVLEEYGCVLCWETFLGARRFAKPSDIVARCHGQTAYGMCYDTSHLAQGVLGILEDFYEYGDIIKVFHLSNWSRRKGQHLPLRHRGGVIDFRLLLEKLGQDFDGVGTLEYRKPYHEYLARDAQWANEFCY